MKVVDLRIVVEELKTDLVEIVETERHAQHGLAVDALRRMNQVLA